MVHFTIAYNPFSLFFFFYSLELMNPSEFDIFHAVNRMELTSAKMVNDIPMTLFDE